MLELSLPFGKKRDKTNRTFVRSEKKILYIVEFFQNFSFKSLKPRRSLSLSEHGHFEFSFEIEFMFYNYEIDKKNSSEQRL